MYFSQILFSQDHRCSSIKQEGVVDCPQDNIHNLHDDGRKLGCDIAFYSSPLRPTFPNALRYQDKLLRARQVDCYIPHAFLVPFAVVTALPHNSHDHARGPPILFSHSPASGSLSPDHRQKSVVGPSLRAFEDECTLVYPHHLSSAII